MSYLQLFYLYEHPSRVKSHHGVSYLTYRSMIDLSHYLVTSIITGIGFQDDTYMVSYYTGFYYAITVAHTYYRI